MEPGPPADPYSASRIKRGAAYLLVGKAITSFAGIGTFVLLIRGLSVEEFAAYSILFALVEIVDALTGVGLGQILARYVPELYVQGRIRPLQRLVTLALGVRVAVLGSFLALIYFLAPFIAPAIGLEAWQWALQAYLLVVLLRIAETTLFGVLESMLNQAVAQLGFSVVTALRFALLAIFTIAGTLDLETVILIELGTDAIGLLVMAGGLAWTLPRQSVADGGASAWLRGNLGRMLAFGLQGYMQHLLILPYGGATNRLLVGGMLASNHVALFGFAQSVADLMERYLPVSLLAGVIRPVLTARYVRDGRFDDLRFIANVLFKINAFFICAAAVVILSGGAQLLSFVSAGKYADGTGLLVLMCALVLAFSMRHMLDHVSHAVERNGPLIWANAVITFSIVPGIALLPTLGVYALPLANLVGTVIGCTVLTWRLARDGFVYRYDVRGLVALLAASGLAGLIGEVCRLSGLPWFANSLIASLGFLVTVVLLRTFSIRERSAVMTLVRRRSGDQAEEQGQPA